MEVIKYYYHRRSRRWSIVGVLYRRTTPPHIDESNLISYCAAQPLAYDRQNGPYEDRKACCGGRCLSAPVNDFSTVNSYIHIRNSISIAHIAKWTSVGDITTHSYKSFQHPREHKIVGDSNRI